ncbi:MAG: TetR/AcrR family transcriptional regulator [Acidimicrobiales bacterium]|nr:TetR/AcrR family transcriptional regulator [Acidimicrobiales bacterium]
MPRQTDPKNLERLLGAAAELFLVEGYDGASMQQIADSVDLHKSSLYHYVSGKEDLLARLTSEAQSDAEDNLAEAEGSSDKKEALINALTFAIDQTLNDLGKVSLVLRQKPDSVTGERITARRRDHDRRLAAIIEAAQISGDVNDDIHPVLLSRLLLGMIAWLVEWYDPKRTRFDKEMIREAILSVVINGVIQAKSD